MMPAPQASFHMPSAIPLDQIEWPEVPGYGIEHAMKTAQLTKYLAECDNMSEADKKVLWALSLLHDIGRTEPHNQPDTGHYTRSADMADAVLKTANQDWSHPDFRSEVCRLIAHHSYKEDTSDPRLLILHDVERVEVCRFNPNTKVGLQEIKNVCALHLFNSPVCKNMDFVRTWMKYRGWTI